MKPLKMRIYYDSVYGEIIHQLNIFGDSPIEYDIVTYKSLSERNRETFDVLELPFGAYAQEFTESNGYRVNIETKTLEFSYPDLNEPEAPQVFQKPMSEQIEDVRLEMARGNSELFETMIMLTGGGF